MAVSKGVYETAKVYYSKHTDGSIKILGLDESLTEQESKKYDLVKGLPVGINTPKGTYYYTISLNKIGKFYSEGNKLGRIYGPEAESNNLSSVVNDTSTTVDGDEIKKNEYACTYTVAQSTCKDDAGNLHNIPGECNLSSETIQECRTRICAKGNYCVKEAESYYVCSTEGYSEGCVKKSSRDEALSAVGCNGSEDCANNYNCCPNCTVECVGKCISTIDKFKEIQRTYLLLNFRTITPARININDRQMGYNWDVNNVMNVLVARKAANTISEIQRRADVSSAEGLDTEELREIEDYDFKVKLTPTIAKKVREYNKNNASNGSYNNDTMECYDYQIDGMFGTEKSCEAAGYTWKDEKCVMEHIFCYSTFIDSLIEWGGVDDAIAAKRNAAKENASFNKEYSLKSKLPYQDTNIVTNDYWTIYIYNSLDINGDKVPDIGPSWK